MIVSFNPNITASKRNNTPQIAKNNSAVAFGESLSPAVLKKVTTSYISMGSLFNSLMHHIGLRGKDFNTTEAVSDFNKALKGQENNPRVVQTKNFLAEKYNLKFD